MKELLKQLWLLLRRNFLLRTRQPVVLALELLWPILIFLAIMSARKNIAPINKPTCYYNGWALPSVGAVPFLQSLICNIDNDCLNRSFFSDVPTYPNSRVEALVQNVAPLLENHKLLGFVEALPRGMRLARVALDALTQHDLQQILDKGIPVKTLLKDNVQSRNILSHVLSRNSTDALFDSYLQFPELLELFYALEHPPGLCHSDFSLSHSEDKSFLFAEMKENFCSFNATEQMEILLSLQGQLDIANIVHMVSHIMSHFGREDIGHILLRIGAMLRNLPSTFFHTSVNNKNEENHLFSLVSSLGDALQNIGKLDFTLIANIAEDFSPLYEENSWMGLKTIIDQLKRIGMYYSAKNSHPRNANKTHSSFSLERENNMHGNGLNESHPSLLDVLNNSTIDFFETFVHILYILPEKSYSRDIGLEVFAVLRFTINVFHEFVTTFSPDDIQPLFDTAESFIYTLAGKKYAEGYLEVLQMDFCNSQNVFNVLLIPNDTDKFAAQKFMCKYGKMTYKIINSWKQPMAKVKYSDDRLDGEETVTKLRSLSYKYRNDAKKGWNLGHNFKTILLRLQVAVTNFFKRIYSNKNFKQIVVTFLEAAHPALKKSAHLESFISSFGNVVHGLARGLNEVQSEVYSKVKPEEKNSLPWLIFIQRLRSTLISEIENFMKMFFRSALSQEKKFNATASHHMTYPEVDLSRYMVQNSSSSINWTEIVKDADSIKNILTSMSTASADSKFKYSSVIGMFSAINIGMIFSTFLLPIPECLTPTTDSVTVCYIMHVLNAKECLKLSSETVPLPMDYQVLSPHNETQNTSAWTAYHLSSTCGFRMQRNKTNITETQSSVLNVLVALEAFTVSTLQQNVSYEESVKISMLVARLIGSRFYSNDEKAMAFFHTVHSIVNLFRNRLEAVNISTADKEVFVVRVEDIFPDSPRTQKVIKGLLPHLPDIVSTVLWTSLAQGKLNQLAYESQKNLTIVMQLLCNSSTTNFLYNPMLKPAEWDNLMGAVCAHHYFEVFEELLEDPDIQNVIFEADNTEDDIEWEDFNDGIVQLVLYLKKISWQENGSADATTAPANTWNKLAKGIGKTLQKPPVIIYIVANSVFYRFCNQSTYLHSKLFPSVSSSSLFPFTLSKSNISQMSAVLCTMRTESFIQNMLDKISEAYKMQRNFISNQTTSVVHPKWHSVYETAMNETRIRYLLQAFLGEEGYVMFKNLESLLFQMTNSSSFHISKVLNAVESVYFLVDILSEEKLTSALSNSVIPQMAENFIDHIKAGNSFSYENIIENHHSLEKFMKLLKKSENKEKEFYRLLSDTAAYFSNKTNAEDLLVLCSLNSTLKDLTEITVNDSNEMLSQFCNHKPLEWVSLSKQEYGHNVKKLSIFWKHVLEELSKSEIRKKMVAQQRKQENMRTKNLLVTAFHHVFPPSLNTSVLLRPESYFHSLRTVFDYISDSVLKEAVLCPYGKNFPPWAEIPLLLVNAVPDEEFLLCDLLSRNLSSSYNWFSKSLKFKEIMSGIKNWMKLTKEEKALCTSVKKWQYLVVRLARNITDFTERIYMRHMTGTNYRKKTDACAENIAWSMFLKSITDHGRVVKSFASLASKLSSMKPSRMSRWNDFWHKLATYITAQLPGFSELSTLVHPTFKQKAKNTLELVKLDAENVIRILEESALNVNWLVRRNFSEVALKKALCSSHSRPNTVIHFPPLISARESRLIFWFLCNGTGINVILSSFNTTLLRHQLPEMQKQEFSSGVWLNDLFSASEVLTQNIMRIVKSIRPLASNKTRLPLKGPLGSFSQITRVKALDEIISGLNVLLMQLEPIMAGSELLDSVQQILDGVQAFQALKRFNIFELKLKVHEIFSKTETVSQLLQNEFHLNASTIKIFMDADVDLGQLFSDSSEKENSSIFCSDRNGSTANQTESYISPSTINNQSFDEILCFISSKKEFQISPSFLGDLALGKLLKNLAELGLHSILLKAEVDETEAYETVKILEEVHEIMPVLDTHIKAVLSALGPEVEQELEGLQVSQRGVALLGTPKALSVGGKIFCGKPLRTLHRRFSLLTLNQKEPVLDKNEMKYLNNDFCREGYEQVMKMTPGGPILWGFLKPLFRGKILYAPKYLPVAEAVINELNSTFERVGEYVHLLRAVAEGTTGLHYLDKKAEALESIKNLLNSKPVARLFGKKGDVLNVVNTRKWREWRTMRSGEASKAVLDLVALVGNVSQCIELNRFIGFDSETELEKEAAKLHSRREFIAAIVFMPETAVENNHLIRNKRNYIKFNTHIPAHVRYKIRMDIDNVPSAKEIRYRWWRPNPYDDFFDDFRYFRGFIQLQELVDLAIMRVQSSMHNISLQHLPKKYLQQIPYPCHKQDKFGTVLKSSMPGVMTISWIFLIAFLVRDRVLERELGLDEILRVMGLHPAAGWLAWFLTGLITLLVSVVGIVIVLKCGGIVPRSDPVILFLFIFTFAILLLAYCQLMSMFFRSATAAALVAIVVYVLSFFPFLLFVTWEVHFQFWHRVLTCILVATSFCFGSLYINRFEDQGQGVQFSNIWKSPLSDDPMSLGMALVSMVICSGIYFLLAAKLSKVCPGSNNGRVHSWFCCFFSCFRRPKSAHCVTASPTTIHNSLSNDKLKEFKNSKCGVCIENLHLIYAKGEPGEKKAVSNLNLYLREGQITTLLGHNGAGKTSTIKVLTGRLHPTAGSVTVYGHSIPKCMSSARKLIGYCPQYNTLYGKLSIKEHLYLFARLKGLLSEHQIQNDIDRMLDYLDLKGREHEPSVLLSGGQQRRLCVGMAFIGGSKLIVLDEPTSSVDPLARRSIWDLIVQHRQGRTILLTTHHLDEADILSDHVAVLHKGQLLCSGSPLALKATFGSGYQLSLFCPHDASDNDDDSGKASSSSSLSDYDIKKNMDGNGTMEFIQRFVPSASLLKNDESKLVVSLPNNTEQFPGQLTSLFRELDTHMHSLGFKSYSVSSTSLEEVFLTLCALEDSKAFYSNTKLNPVVQQLDFIRSSLKKMHHARNAPIISDQEAKIIQDWPQDKGQHEVNISDHEDVVFTPPEMDTQLLLGFGLIWSQLQGLLKKRLWHTRRNWKTVLSGIILPCLFIALAMALAVGKPASGRPETTLRLTPTMYRSPNGNFFSFFYSDNTTSSAGHSVLDFLLDGSSQKNSCYDMSNRDQNCSIDINNRGNLPRCLCWNEEECRISNSINQNTPFLIDAEKVFLNYSNLDLPKQLLGSYLTFSEKRYGGWSVTSAEEHQSNSSEVLDVTKVWFDNSGYHAAPSFLNALNNAIFKTFTKDKERNFEISTYNHPLQLSAEQLSQKTLLQRLGEIGIAFVFLIGLSLIPSTSSVYLVREWAHEERLVQKVGPRGVSSLLYWMAAFIWDLTLILCTLVLASGVILSFSLPSFVHRENFLAVIALMFCFGWAMTPLMYMASRCFSEPSLSFMVLFTLNLFIGLIIMLVVLSLHMLNISHDAETTLHAVKQLGLLFPQYSLVGGLMALAQNQLQSDIFARFGQDTYASPFSSEMLRVNYLTLLIEGVVFFVANVILEAQIFPLIYRTIREWKNGSSSNLRKESKGDIDASSNDVLRLENICKVYPCRRGFKYAVRKVSLGIREGECFGLVGANGAGKTTLFRILSGQILPTMGKIKIVDSSRNSLSDQKKKSLPLLGYCPQVDALDALLTPTEHLYIYSKLKGIHPSCLDKVVENALVSFDLKGHADFQVRALSGGTKRKLCTAIAMIGNPSFVLLDEPTSGMDPVTRRLVWKSITAATKRKTSIIISSHSIEECDILCSRLGIMVNGSIQCLGTPHQLKNRFGGGYTVTCRLNEAKADVASVRKFIVERFPAVQLKAQHYSTIEFAFPRGTLVADMLEHFEIKGKHLGLHDLSINPTTLDQVFVGFVRRQSDGMQGDQLENRKLSKNGNSNHVLTDIYSNPAYDDNEKGTVVARKKNACSLEENETIHNTRL